MVVNFLFWWTKQIFFLVIKLEPRLLSWLQPRKNNCVPTELDVSISATVSETPQKKDSDRSMFIVYLVLLFREMNASKWFEMRPNESVCV